MALSIMPESIRKFLESLPADNFKEVWLYFEQNAFAVEEMNDVLVESHPNAEATEKETT
jgi:hypothetical protein